MPPCPPGSFNRHERYGRILAAGFAIMVCVVGAAGCGRDADPPGVERLKPARRSKPEGALVIVRQLDLGTLPLNGSMELLLSAKNPTQETIVVDRIEVDRPGVEVTPTQVPVEPGDSLSVIVNVTPEGTAKPGTQQWDVAAWTADGTLAYRMTFFLIVKDDVVVPRTDAKVTPAEKDSQSPKAPASAS